MNRAPRRLVLSLLALVLLAATPALASPPALPAPLAPAARRESGPSAPVVTPRGATTQWVFSTRDRRFRPHTSNQGYWANRSEAHDANDNYLVGRCCGAGEFRDFFTFYLAGLQGTVVNAQLVLQKYDGRGGHEKLRLVSTTTNARKLNDNQGINLRIFKDLGRGTSYGTFRLPTKGDPTDTYTLDLNANALDAIHNHAGGFFSLGGHLVSLRNGGFLFAQSGGRGPQELIVTTTP